MFLLLQYNYIAIIMTVCNWPVIILIIFYMNILCELNNNWLDLLNKCYKSLQSKMIQFLVTFLILCDIVQNWKCNYR